MRTYKYRIYPTNSQIKSLEKTFDLCRFLYNCALEERISHYKRNKKSLSCFDQQKHLPKVKEELPEFKNVHSQVLYSTLQKLDRSYKAFFRRFKNGEKAGFPRFKGKNRFNSILYPQSGFSLENIKGKKGSKKATLKLSKIGNIKIVLHRNIKGTIKNCIITKSPANKWYICLVCDNIPKEPINKTNQEVGIDLGIKNLLALSNNEIINNPKHFNKSKDKLAKKQRKLSKLDWKTNDQRIKRNKAKLSVARQHEKIKNQRMDFYHKLSKNLVKRFDKIYVEKLNIKDMKSFRVLNREIQNVAWDKFVLMLLYKAESADKEVIQVDPRNTSSMCSGCGDIIKKDLSIRIHECMKCELKIDRDINAAINIFNRGKSLQNDLVRESRDILSELPKALELI